MVAALRHLPFGKQSKPAHDDVQATAEKLASILQEAQAIGRAHAGEELERGINWGGGIKNLLDRAWNIATTFIGRITGWISGRGDGDVAQEDIDAEVISLAETVASVEVPTAIEEEVLATLQRQDFMTIQWYAQPGACAACQARADMGPVPIGTDFNGVAIPTAHPHCRCSIGAPAE